MSAAARRRLMSVFDAGWYAFLKVNGVSPLLRLYGHRGDATWWAFPARFDNAFSAVLRQLFGRR